MSYNPTENSALKDKTASILVIEPSSGVRPIITSVIRELGFNQPISLDSLSGSLDVLSAESIDWMIVSTFADDKINLLQLLKLLRDEPQLRNVKVSFFASDDEREFLAKAFSLGLFTAHTRPFNKDSFKQEFSNILSKMESYNWNSTLVSADYLRPILVERNDLLSRLKFEQAINAAFPSESSQLIHLAEAHFAVQNHSIARSLLWQALQRNPSLESKAVALGQCYSESQGADGKTNWDNLKLDSCVVVEPDTTIQSGIREALLSCGAKNIAIFDRGDQCWQWLKSNKEPDLLIMEWRIPEVSGSMLLQRCRSQGMHLLPIIVQSSLVPKNEEALLKEMGVNEVLAKPFRPEIFLNCVASVLSQTQRPTEFKDLEQRIRSLLAGQKMAEATNLLQVYLTKNRNPDDEGAVLISAEFAFASGDYKTARDIATNSIRQGNKSVVLMNLLGKSLIRLREFSAALQVLERADGIAPNSVARLCAITEVKQELGDTQGAQKILKQVNNFDAENQDVINTNLNIGVVTGDGDKVASAIDRFTPNENILAYLNNSAIVRVKSGQIDSAIDLYQKAIESIPPDKTHLKAIIGYNLALAQVRKNDLKSALVTLVANTVGGDETISRKARSLNERVQIALRNGTTVQLVGEPESINEAPSLRGDIALLLRRFSSTPSIETDVTSCCYGLYADESLDTKNILGLLASVPTIKSKEAIIKGKIPAQ